MTSVDAARRTGLWSSGASVLSAVLSSACCWLPLGMLAVGASAVGVSAVFEKLRPVFLVVAAISLGSGFYLNYFRKEQCAPGTACATPNRKLKRFNRVMLWVATGMVLIFALFPNYVGVILGDGGSATARDSKSMNIELGIEGMTCQGCAVTLEKALSRIDGVQSAAVSFDDARAVVTVDATARPTVEELVAAVEKAGFRARPPGQGNRNDGAPADSAASLE